jgi:hypothetical protein
VIRWETLFVTVGGTAGVEGGRPGSQVSDRLEGRPRGDRRLAVLGASPSQQYPGPDTHCGAVQRPASLRSLPGRPGRFDVDLESGTLEKIRPALISRRAQGTLQDHGDSIRALLGDGLVQLAIVLAVTPCDRCQVGAREDQFDDGLAGRAVRRY